MTIVLRDTLAYTAGRYRFQVVNVADPRNPERVGVLVHSRPSSGKLVLSPTVAFMPAGQLYCIDISDPTSPSIIGNWPGFTQAVAVVDTVAYVVAGYTGCVSLSVADSTAPYVLDSLHMTDTLWWNDVVVEDSLAYVGGRAHLGS